MKTEIVNAREAGAKLDSNVHVGGGTDDTAVLQSILDRAREKETGIHLILDGAALVRGLKVYSDTTIECLNEDCGFFLADWSNGPIITNGNWSTSERIDRNITLMGGLYNHNCQHQEHHIIHEDPAKNYMDPQGLAPKNQAVVALEFWGIENLTIRDLTIMDQRTYAALLANWYRVEIDHVRIELPHREHYQNQDGFHFFGPGQFLEMHNVSGRTSDDFIALAPDENDAVSSITDVLIDGVCLDDADQAVRMLCHGKGRLDRVVIKNVTGTYRSFGFFMNPFFDTGEGSYGNIVIDTVDLRSNGIDYEYTTPFLFRVGGRFESLTLRNIYHHTPQDRRALLDIGWQYYADSVPIKPEHETKVGAILIDGLHIYENAPEGRGEEYIRIQKSHIQNLTLRNVELVRSDDAGTGGTLLCLYPGADLKTTVLGNITAQGLEHLVQAEQGHIASLFMHDLLMLDCGEQTVKGNGVEQLIEG